MTDSMHKKRDAEIEMHMVEVQPELDPTTGEAPMTDDEYAQAVSASLEELANHQVEIATILLEYRAKLDDLEARLKAVEFTAPRVTP